MTAAQGAVARTTEGRPNGGRRARRPGAPRITVVVTKDIIDRSEQRDSSHCMLAEAVKAAVPNAQKVSVDLQTIRFTDPEKRLRYIYLTPRQAQVALILFDQGKHNDPFTVFLRGAQVIKMGDPAAPRARSATPAMPEGTKAEFRQPSPGNPHDVPLIIGGTAPPTGPLTNTTYRGKRRAFGLRLLKY
jgi:hypothetical protein